MKAYVKPELFYERYELSQHIADCALELQLNDSASCYAIPDPNLTTSFNSSWHLFVTGNGQCDVQYENYCYTVDAGGYNLWRS